MTTKDLAYSAAPHPYTPAVAAGDLVFVTGHLCMSNGQLVKGGAAAEAKQALQNAALDLANTASTSRTW
ncbi:RidA family protein (plasmid) [Arthrobacter sp. D3-18]